LTTSPTMVAKEKVQEYFGSHDNLTANLLSRVDEDAIRMFMMEE